MTSHILAAKFSECVTFYRLLLLIWQKYLKNKLRKYVQYVFLPPKIMLDECRICIPLRACVQTGLRNGRRNWILMIWCFDDWNWMEFIIFDISKIVFSFFEQCLFSCFISEMSRSACARPNGGSAIWLKLMSRAMSRTIFSYQNIYFIYQVIFILEISFGSNL